MIEATVSLEQAVAGWNRETLRADDAEAAVGENCKRIAQLEEALREILKSYNPMNMSKNPSGTGEKEEGKPSPTELQKAYDDAVTKFYQISKAPPPREVQAEETGLLPCPFCGGEAEIRRTGSGHHSSIICCTECGCRLESNENDWNTGEQWNNRVPLTSSPDSSGRGVSASSKEKAQDYPSVFNTPEKQAAYERAKREIDKALEPIIDELRDCTKLTAADYAVTINAR